jgi:hypothetical protein
VTKSYGLFIEGNGDPVDALAVGAKVFVLDADEFEAELVAAGVGYVRIAATLREPGPRNGTPGALFVRKAVAEVQSPATAVVVEGTRDARTT